MQPLKNCIGPTICIGRDILCLQYAGFFLDFFWFFWIVLYFLNIFFYFEILRFFVIYFLDFFLKFLRLLHKVTEVTNEHQKRPKLSKNRIKSSFIVRMKKKKASVGGQSLPQELEVSPQ